MISAWLPASDAWRKVGEMDRINSSEIFIRSQGQQLNWSYVHKNLAISMNPYIYICVYIYISKSHPLPWNPVKSHENSPYSFFGCGDLAPIGSASSQRRRRLLFLLHVFPFHVTSPMRLDLQWRFLRTWDVESTQRGWCYPRREWRNGMMISLVLIDHSPLR